MSRKRAFTLLELLIVIVIIAGLLAILMPAMSGVRSKGRLTACAANLRQIGMGFKSYLGDNNDIFPLVSAIPSYTPFPIQGDTPVYISEVLAPHMNLNQEETSKVFACPMDVGERIEPNNGKPFFVTEKSSYAMRGFLGGISMAEYIKRWRERENERPGGPRPVSNENNVWIMNDYDNFHARAGQNGARRYLYYDGRVTDYEE